MPVSMLRAGSGSRWPSAMRWYCMNTRFQISITCGSDWFTRSRPGMPEAAFSSAVRMSMWISEQGPQGPVSPISQKLSCLLPRRMWSSGRYLRQACCASVSSVVPSSAAPSNTVA